MQKKPDPFLFVIFGGSGDLNKRKLMPALFNLFSGNLLPENFAILSLGRTHYSEEAFRAAMEGNLEEFAQSRPSGREAIRSFCGHLHYLTFDMSRHEEYSRLNARLQELDQEHDLSGSTLYYLAIPPDFVGTIATELGFHGLHQPEKPGSWKRVIIEKPFGRDLPSAIELNARLSSIFAEDQLYRIDHYLGKETVQNILALRFANGIFEPIWNRHYVHHVEITAAEQLGVQDRGGYYDTSGALRDMLQNHLLQIAATIAMEPPAQFAGESVRNERIKLFHSLRPLQPGEVGRQVVRGQYLAATIDGEEVPAYRREKNVDPHSMTETFVALKCYIDNWRWSGVPFYIRTGKRLPTRVTEAVIHFRETPHKLFHHQAHESQTINQLILRIQPDEGILLRFGMKVPGAGFTIKNVSMDFHYSDLADSVLPEAYERLLLDALNGDGTLYARADAVEAAWRFVAPIQEAWATDPAIKLSGYPAGTWGPREAAALFDSPEEEWRYPCKSLTGDESYCEL